MSNQDPQCDTFKGCAPLQVVVEKLNNIDDKMKSVLEQAQKTNGRVSELEKWKERVYGLVIGANVALATVWTIIVFFLK